MTHDRTHGGPYDRGSADRYYHRSFKPHKFVDHQLVEDLTEDERAAYAAGYDEEDDGKDYGPAKISKRAWYW